MAITPNMGMLLPIVSTTVGPLYAFENNQAFSVIDSHNHAPGNGAPIPTSALSIDADLPINSFNVTLIRSSRYTSNVSPLSLPSDIRSVYVVGGDLYYNNGIGQQIQITAGAALNATTVGGIGGDYATSSASVFYTSFSSTFTFWSAVNTPAIIDVGPITIREVALSPFGITLNSPSALSADYSLTLPNALPASTKIMTLDNAGNIAAVYGVDNSTIEVASNVIRVKAQGITASQILNNTITANQINTAFLQAINPTGAITMYGGTTAPGGFFICDGSTVSRTTYSDLYAVIGDSFGNGDGSTTFNVPDFRGIFPRGVDSGAGRDPNAASRTAPNPGANTGDNVGSYQPDEFRSHSHVEVGSVSFAGPGFSTVMGAATLGSNTPATTIHSTLTTGGSETRPINLYVNFIIKY